MDVEYVRKLCEDLGTVKKFRTDSEFFGNVELEIETPEGVMKASPGDYIITGVHGEKYPCKPDIFKETINIFTFYPKNR